MDVESAQVDIGEFYTEYRASFHLGSVDCRAAEAVELASESLLQRRTKHDYQAEIEEDS
jgi:hypothetical protein